MRVLATVALVLLLAFAPPRATAPPAPLTDHLSVLSGTLTPGVNQTWALEFEGGPLQKGWVFLLEARVSGSITAVLSLDGITAKTWSITPTAWYDTFVLPGTGVYDLTLSNPGTSPVAFRVYFDQSCSCSAKWFPKAMPDGLIIFNVEVPRASTVVAQFNKPLAMTIRVTAALLARPGGRWPDDFTELGEVDTPVPRRADPSLPPVLLYEVNVSAPAGARVYYFVEGASYNPADDTATDDLARLVAPFIDFAAPPPSPISPLVFVGLAGALALVGVTVWKWPAISERIPSRFRREPGRPEGKEARKKRSQAGRNRTGKKARPAHRGGDRGGRGTRTSRGRSRRS